MLEAVLPTTTGFSRVPEPEAACPCADPAQCHQNGLVEAGPRTSARCEKFAQWRAQQRRDTLLAGVSMPRRFRDCSLSHTTVPPEAAKALAACQAFLEHPSDRGLVLGGTAGTGKTYLVAGTVNDLVGRGIECRFVVAPDLFGRLRQAFQDGASSEEILAAAMAVPVLAVDDLGTEKPTDWVREQVYRLINRRYEERLATLITTNLRPNELADSLGERIVSRMAQMCEWVWVGGKDRRYEAGARAPERKSTWD